MILVGMGVLLWAAAHLFKRIAPEMRARMGDAGKGLVAVLLLVSIALMVLGYRAADYVAVWAPPAYFIYINNLLMLFAFYSFGAGAAKSLYALRIRHPMLTAVKAWAVAHLVVNGDLASIVLFGGILAWAVLSVIVINRAEDWTRPSIGSAKGDLKALVIGAILLGCVSGVHILLGVSPFGV